MLPDEQGRVSSLAALARALGRADSLPGLLETAAEAARRTLRAASVSVSRLEDGVRVRTLVNVGDLGPGEERWPSDEVYDMDELHGLDTSVDALVTWAWNLDDPHLPDVERVLLERLEKGASVSAPLVVDGRLWGEVYATRHRGDDPFDAADIAFLDALLAILAGALSRFTREQSLEALAFRDSLTGLANRRALDDAAARAFLVRPGRRREVCAVVLDINGLKKVNDTAGHGAGDRLICDVARRLVDGFAAMPGSVVARVGGDEFTVLVTDHALADVVAVADCVTVRSWDSSPATALSSGAAGVVLTGHDDVLPPQLFAAADAAQYVAKRRRRRTTVVDTGLAAMPR